LIEHRQQRQVNICSWNLVPDTHHSRPREDTAKLLRQTIESIQPDVVLLQEPIWVNGTIINILKANGGTEYESGGNVSTPTSQQADIL